MLNINNDGLFLNLHSILQTQMDQIATSTEQLTTGERINSAADDVAGVVISTRLSSMILGNSQSIQNVLDAISMIGTADSGLSSMQSMVQHLNELVIQAKNGTNSSADITNIQTEVDDVLKGLNDIVSQTIFNKVHLLDPTANPTTSPTFGFYSTNNAVASPDTLLNNADWQDNVNVNTIVDTQEITSQAYGSATAALGVSGSFAINDGTSHTINIVDTDSVTDIMNKINSSGANVTASIGTGNRLSIKSNVEGTAGAFSMTDLTSFSNNFFSNNVAAVDALTLLDNSEWSHDVAVSKLAEAQQVQTNSQASATNALGLSGTFKLAGQNFNVIDSMSLSDIKDMINNANLGLAATIDSNNRMVLTDNKTGATNTFYASDLTGNANVFSSSDTTVATADNLLNNTEWNKLLTVNQLATGQDDASDTVANPNAALGYAGTFQIGSASYTVTATNTANDIINMINTNTGTTGIQATLDPTNRIRIQSTSIGATSAFSVSDTTANSNNYNSSNTLVAVTGTLLSNTTWGHTIDVSQLASTQSVTSDAQTSATTSLGIIGSFKIDNTTFNVQQGNSLTDIMNMINIASTDVTASIDSTNKLILTSKTSGAAGSFVGLDLSSNISIFDSSNTGVATTDTLLDNTNWSHNVDVLQLATAMQVASQTVASTTSALNISGSFTLSNPTSSATSTFNITDNMSLTDIMNMINNDANISPYLKASISSGKLQLTANQTGADGAFLSTDNTVDSSVSSSSDTSVVNNVNVVQNTDWSYNVDVQQLATYMQIKSDTQINATAPLNVTGTFQINGVNFNVVDSNTLSDIRDMINTQNSTTKVSASISGSNELMLTSAASGIAGAITVKDLTATGNVFSSSNTSVATTNTLINNTNWTHVVDVIQLAKGQESDSDSQTSSTNPLGLNGTFTVAGQTFTMTQNMSLTDMMNMINSNSTVSSILTASIVSNKLVLKSNNTGATTGFTATDISTNSNTYSSTDPTVASTTTLLSNTNWSHLIDISQLAQEQQTETASQSSATAALGLTGGFKINNTTFNVAQTDTLMDIRNKINGVNMGITASVDASNRLILTSNTTGVVNAFTVKDLTATTDTLASSNTSVVTPGTLLNTLNWSHVINVQQIAQGLEVETNAQTSATNPLGISGQFNIAGQTFTMTDNMSLTDMMNMINSNSTVSSILTASIVSNKLVLNAINQNALGTFLSNDITTNNNIFSSNDPTIASTNTLMSNTDWSHDIIVTQLAKSQQVESATQTSTTNPLGLTGDFKINNVTFSVNQTQSMNDMMNLINTQTATTGVAASIDSNNRLVLTSNKTGVANAFTTQDLTANGNAFTSSNTGVASTDTLISNLNWSHTVTVLQVAQNQESDSSAQATTSSPLGLSGQFTINPTTGSSRTFSVTDNMSLTDMASLINTQQSTTNVQASIVGNKLVLTSLINGALGSFNAIDNTTNSNVYSSTNTGVATTDTLLSNTDWSHIVDVTQLAKNQITQSNSLTSATNPLGYNGSFKIDSTTFMVNQNQSLNDIQDLINTQSSTTGVTASVDSSNRLILASVKTGVVNAFTAQDISTNNTTFSSTNTSVATTGTLLNNTNWIHTVNVSQLAQYQTNETDGQTSATNPLGISGQFSITDKSGTAYIFTVTDNMSLTDVANTVNGVATDVTASINGTNLVFTSKTLGSAGAFTTADITTDSNVLSSSDPTKVTNAQLLDNTDWNVTVNVLQLAQQMIAQSNAQTSATNPLGYNGSFKIDGATFSVSQSQSLTDVVNMINIQTTNTNVQASIDSNNRLVLTSTKTGVSNAFTAQDLSTNSITFSSSNTGVATTNTLLDNTTWSHIVSINQLASQQVERGSDQLSVTNPLLISGQFSLTNPIGGASTTFNVTDSMSLTDIRNMINTANMNISASITGSALVLTSNVLGAAGAFNATDLTTFTTHLTSSNTSVANPGTLLDTTEWQHVVNVNQLAQNQQVESGAIASTTTALGYTGSFQIDGAVYNVSANQSLTDIMNMINASTPPTGVVASINSNKLILTSNATGASQAFTSQDLTANNNIFSSNNTGSTTTGTLINNTNWSHTVNVSQMADLQQVISDAVASPVAALGYAGTFTIGSASFNVIESDTLQDIMNKINTQTTSTGVAATIVSNKLVLDSTATGSAGAFSAADVTSPYTGYTNSNPTAATVNSILDPNDNWTHTIGVLQLATNQIDTSNSIANINTALGYQGSFKINSVTFNVAQTDSLSNIMNNINAQTATTGVTASIDPTNHLQLQSTQTGTINSFTVTDLTNNQSNPSTTNSSIASIVTVNNPVNWTHDVNVLQNAQGEQVQGTTSFATNVALGYSGTFTINGQTFNILDSDTLTNIMNKINTQTTNTNVVASISSGKLVLSNNTAGAGATINAVDNTVYSNSFTDSNPSIATATLLSPDSEFSHTVEVDQLAGTYIQYNTTQTTTDFNGVWKNGMGTWNTGTTLSNNSATGVNIAYIQNTGSYTADRSVSWDVTLSAGQTTGMAGGAANYLDNNNYAYAAIDIGTNQLVLGKVINGVKTESRQNVGTDLVAGQQYNVSWQSDTNGNVIATLKDSTGYIMKQMNISGWTDVVSISANAGAYTNGAKATFDNFTVGSKGGTLQTQAAMYKIDGASYTNTSNTITIPDAQGNPGAQLNLVNIGTTTITNSVTNAVLQSLGVLNGSGSYTNITKNAQDMAYKVDGGATQYTTTGKNVNIGDATINLNGTLGTTTIKNVQTNAVMQDIGMLTSVGAFANQLQVAQNALYTIDGGSPISSAYNNNVAITIGGKPTVNVNLVNAGQNTTIKNTYTTNILTKLGLLTNTGTWKNQTNFAKDAKYTVDGGATITSSKNNGLALGGDATFNIAGTGFSTIKNVQTNAILQNIGLIDGSSNYLHVDSVAQDAQWTVDGQIDFASSNNITIRLAGHAYATLLLNGLGSTTIQNLDDNAILQSLGILNTDGTWANEQSKAQDLQYMIDGGSIQTQDHNNNIGIAGDATIDIHATGNVTVSNTQTTAILQTLGLLSNPNTFAASAITQMAKDAQWTVDGITNSSWTNKGVTITKSGVNKANVDLVGIGNSIISNVVNNAILKDLGMLTPTNIFKNTLAKAQDTKYTIDGGAVQTSNSNIGLNLVGDSTFNITGVGTAKISNNQTTAILQAIGMLSSSNTFATGSIVQAAQDAQWTVDGGATKSSWTNNDITIGNGTTAHGTIDLVNIGTTIVQNIVDNAILQTLGFIDNTEAWTTGSLVKKAQDLQYKVDGGPTQTKDVNTGILLTDTSGNNQAIIDVTGAGTTTIQNKATNSVLQDIGVINNTNTFLNVLQMAQDAQWTVDGGATQSSWTNSGITLKNGATNQATIDLHKLGETIVQNVVDNAVLQTLGLINSSNNYLHIDKQAQDALYTIDGGTLKDSNTNNNINIGDATINFIKAGTSTVSNTSTNAIMETLGMITNTGTWAMGALVKAAQNAQYTVDGGAIQNSSTNNGVTIKSSSNISQATIDFHKIGTTTVSNTVYSSVLQKMGMLTSSGTFKNQVSTAQDAQYKVDGLYNSSSTNNNINITDAVIDLKGTGTTTVKNIANTAIMKFLGVLTPLNANKNIITQAQDAQYTINGGPTMTSSTNTQVDLKIGTIEKAKMDLMSIGTSIISNVVTNAVLKALGILNSSNNYQNVIKSAQNAQYKVDGVSYQSQNNNNITIGDNLGTNQAVIDLKGIGTTVVRNVASSAILKTLGILDSSNNFKNVTSQALDALYSMDGGPTQTSSKNTGIYLKNGATNQAQVNLTGIGTTYVSNTVYASVLQKLGILTTTGTFKNTRSVAKDANWTVDGITYTNSNNNIILKDSTGTALADMTLKSIGNTTVRNAVTNAVLQSLGLIDSSNNFVNVIQQAQDAEYTVDGGPTKNASTNTVFITDSKGNNQAKVLLTGLGTATVENQVENAILESMKVITNTGSFLNVVGKAQDTTYTVNGGPLQTSTDPNGIVNIGDALIKVKGIGSTTIINKNPVPPPPFDPLQPPSNLHIHTGYESNHAQDIQLTNMRLEALGLNNLKTTDSNAIDKIKNALNMILQERIKYGSYLNVFEQKRNNLEDYNINLISARSRIQDVDMAKAISQKIQADIKEKFTVNMMSELNKQNEKILQLIDSEL